jgi:hypothetical protein
LDHASVAGGTGARGRVEDAAFEDFAQAEVEKGGEFQVGDFVEEPGQGLMSGRTGRTADAEGIKDNEEGAHERGTVM